MNNRIIIAALSVALLGSAAVVAQGQPAQQPMSFFVAANPTGTGNLGGLEGADRICQNAAAAVGAGNRTWRAYVSQEQRGATPRVNARGRIGNRCKNAIHDLACVGLGQAIGFGNLLGEVGIVHVKSLR